MTRKGYTRTNNSVFEGGRLVQRSETLQRLVEIDAGEQTWELLNTIPAPVETTISIPSNITRQQLDQLKWQFLHLERKLNEHMDNIRSKQADIY